MDQYKIYLSKANVVITEDVGYLDWKTKDDQEKIKNIQNRPWGDLILCKYDYSTVLLYFVSRA
jgi:hypothetical protein